MYAGKNCTRFLIIKKRGRVDLWGGGIQKLSSLSFRFIFKIFYRLSTNCLQTTGLCYDGEDGGGNKNSNKTKTVRLSDILLQLSFAES